MTGNRKAGIFALTGALLALLMAGCETELHNLTPTEIEENPSGIYTFSFALSKLPNDVDQETLRASLTIDGQTYPMERSRIDPSIFSYDYSVAAGTPMVRYYYTIDFRRVSDDGRSAPKSYTTEVFESRLVDSFVLGLETSRGPVGSTVTVLGRKLSPSDQILIGGEPAPTRYVSPNAIQFTVPPLDAGESYEVVRSSGQGAGEVVGVFRVDPTRLQILPSSLEMAVGERRMLVFAIPSPAPEGGLYVEVTTDIPNSVIMPEVVIPGGARSVNVQIEGAESAVGSLFVEGQGFRDTQVPVTIY